MNAFTQVAHRQQLDLDEPPFIGGENPSYDDAVYASDADAFFARANNPRWREKFKWAIITLWQQGGIGTAEAVWWLGEAGFIETDIHPEQAETALQAYVWFERHRAESGRALSSQEAR